MVCVNGVGRFLGDPAAGTAAIVRHIDYLVQRVGAEHVGLGIDYEYDQGLDEDPPGSIARYWWPPAHGYGKSDRDPDRRARAVPGDHPRPARDGLPEPAIRQILGLNMLALAERSGAADAA